MRLVRQRKVAGDCGTAALATLLATRYDDVARVAAAVEPSRCGQRGLTAPQLQRIAANFGIPLTVRREFDLDDDEGVLRLYGVHTHPLGHWVTVRQGRIWCPGLARLDPWRRYAARYDARFGLLLSLY